MTALELEVQTTAPRPSSPTLEARVAALEHKVDLLLARLSWRAAPWYIALIVAAEVAAKFLVR